MNQLISVGIGQYWFGSVIFGLNISLDGLNVKVSINISKDWLILVKMLVEACRYQPILGLENTD